MEIFGVHFLLLLFGLLLFLKTIETYKHPLEIIESNGYPGEAHNVITEDGYILTLHRINGGGHSTPVLLLHGLTCNSAMWLFLGKKKSLPYLLADQGYDIWIANNRGNNYALNHLNMTEDDSKFWDFSYHEMGVYDAPAMIEYISNLSKQKIFFLGFSEGAQVGFIMGCRRPEVSKKIRLMVQLAPIAYLGNIKGFLYQFRNILYNIIKFLRLFTKLDRLFPQTKLLILLEKIICMMLPFQTYFCEIMTFSVLGFDHAQFVENLWEQLCTGCVTGTSIKNVLHYYQAVEYGKFAEYDYGKINNMKIYNQTSPPEYNITEINIPTFLFYAKNDYLSRVESSKKIYKLLSNPVGFHVVDYDKFTHGDFVYAKDVKELLYDHVINLLNSYRKK